MSKNGLACPRCGSTRLVVSHTEKTSPGATRRRRVCRDCGRRFVSVEVLPVALQRPQLPPSANGNGR